MITMLDNYINGNINTARRQGRRFTQLAIAKALHQSYGYSVKKALLTALHIKTGQAWQQACDAK